MNDIFDVLDGVSSGTGADANYDTSGIAPVDPSGGGQSFSSFLEGVFGSWNGILQNAANKKLNPVPVENTFQFPSRQSTFSIGTVLIVVVLAVILFAVLDGHHA